MTDFEKRLTDLLDRKAAAADVSPEHGFLHERPVVALRSRSASLPTRRLLGIAAATVLVIAGVVLTMAVRRSEPASVNGGPDGGISVYYQRVEVTLTAELECADQIDEPGTFTTATIESYSDRVGRRWRSTITYPDGSTYEWIYLGSAIYPTESASRGESHAGVVGCTYPSGERDPVYGLAAFEGGFYSLDLLRELAPDEQPFVMSFTDEATRIDGATDSQGRPVVLWRQIIDGTAKYNGGPEVPLHEVDEWYVDATTPDHVTEHRWTQSTIGIGTVTSAQVLLADDTITVAGDFFDTTGFTLRSPVTKPDLDGGTEPTGVVVAATTPGLVPDPLTAVLIGLGVDRAGAPTDAVTLGDAEFCGWQQVTFSGTTRDAAAQDCLLGAFLGGRAAIYAVSGTTIEGDPVVDIYRTSGGVATMYVDATRDRFGSGQWDVVTCDDLILQTHQDGTTSVTDVVCINDG